MTAVDPAQPARGPVRANERALAPDLARGFMLLLIALANTVWYLWAAAPGPMTAHPEAGGVLDRAVQAVMITAVDGRVYPMFAFLFGYGMTQLWNRQRAAGGDERSVRALLRRRNLWLLAFGFAHAALLWMGDVLGAYGFMGLLMGWLFLRRRDSTLLVWAGVTVGVLLLSTALSAFGALAAAQAPAPDGAFDLMALSRSLTGEENYGTAMLTRVLFWAFLVLAQGLLSFTIPAAILLAFWAARRRVLEEPGNHIPLLRATAIAGITAGWLGGLPSALYHLGAFAVPEAAAWMFTSVAGATGLAAGLGYIALFGLIAHRMSGRVAASAPIVAVTAVGKRSLSCYLAQSVLCGPLLAAWGLGLGAHLGSATMALFALGVWLVTVALAYLQERAGQRGPAETLLRGLAYRNTARSPSPARR